MLYHHSRLRAYKSPQGAVRAGGKLTLTLKAAGEFPRRVYVRAWMEGESCTNMQPLAGRGGEMLFQATIQMPDTPCVWWYYFVAEYGDGSLRAYGNARDNMGGEGAVYVGEEAMSYRVVVYRPDFDPPHFLRDGAMYQIMVDRFYGGGRNKQGIRPEVLVHKDWHDPPMLLVDPQSGDNRAMDFYGGDLQGICEKLPYLSGLGVTVLYLNPIFEANSNHKYDTGDYGKIDPMFGDEADFRRLCDKAHTFGIRVILDGVFSHTGDDSLYFNKKGRYPSVGAYQSKDSPYASWYTFYEFPERYDSWWGFPTLPTINKEDPSFQRFMLRSETGVVPGWILKGASGWRLDVADELPVPFLRDLYASVKKADPQAAVLGEVWEDASYKISYDQPRSYCLGDTLDSVMNYPLREASISFFMGDSDAYSWVRRMEFMMECYPKPFFHSLMNLMGSHDRARIVNALCGMDGESLSREGRCQISLTPGQRALGRKRMLLFWALLCAMPGMPTLYYGDEAGMEGASDPSCRAAFPWGREDGELTGQIRRTLGLRRKNICLRTGETTFLACGPDVVAVVRSTLSGADAFERPAPRRLMVWAVNRKDGPSQVRISVRELEGEVSFLDEAGNIYTAQSGVLAFSLPAYGQLLISAGPDRGFEDGSFAAGL